MRRLRKTKIIATLGPASSTAAVIERLFLEGADVFRLNFSHGTHQEHQQTFTIIRDLEKKHQRPIGILQDLQGPKLRIGTFSQGPVTLKEGQSFCLTLEEKDGDTTGATLPHPEIFQALIPGTELLVDDGKIRLRVLSCTAERAETRVEIPGILSNRKGVNVPGVVLPISALTAKDRQDLEFGLKLGVDWVALSFVQHPSDLEEARRLIGDRAALISKLEKPLALEHLGEIIHLSDGVMVARGDLGVEMAPEEVPPLQREIIRRCRRAGKPVVVATQMLDSMVGAPLPTRAEASDVATAVYDGVDAVMLSAESASGKYPGEAVTMMNKIIERVEKDPLYRHTLESTCTHPEATPSDAIASAARQVAQTISAAAIVTLTHSGMTTLRTAYERPPAPIVALSPQFETAHRLTLVWGTHPIQVQEFDSIEQVIETTCSILLAEKFAEAGDEAILTSGAHFGFSPSCPQEQQGQNFFHPGTTRVLRILQVGKKEDQKEA